VLGKYFIAALYRALRKQINADDFGDLDITCSIRFSSSV